MLLVQVHVLDIVFTIRIHHLLIEGVCFLSVRGSAAPSLNQLVSCVKRSSALRGTRELKDSSVPCGKSCQARPSPRHAPGWKGLPFMEADEERAGRRASPCSMMPASQHRQHRAEELCREGLAGLSAD